MVNEFQMLVTFLSLLAAVAQLNSVFSVKTLCCKPSVAEWHDRLYISYVFSGGRCLQRFVFIFYFLYPSGLCGGLTIFTNSKTSPPCWIT